MKGKPIPWVAVLFLLFLAAGCGGGGGGSGAAAVATIGTSPNGSLSVTSPTAPDNSVYNDQVELRGRRGETITSVSYRNMTNGASGSGQVWTYGYENCYPIVGCTFVVTDWGWTASNVPIAIGENVIRIYGNGLWATTVTVVGKPTVQIKGVLTGLPGVVPGGDRVFVDGIVEGRTFSAGATTDSNGAYLVEHVPPGFEYTMRALNPHGVCSAFVPLFTAYSSVTRNLTATFTEGGAGGYITPSSQAASLPFPADARVELLASNMVTKLSAVVPYYAGSGAYGYLFPCAPQGSHVVRPTSASRTFAPVSRFVNISSGRTRLGFDFIMNMP